jgi:hypothetical protein
MSKLVRVNAILALTMAAAPVILRAQVDPDLPVSATASCFSICVENTNVKGVQGDVTVTNLTSGTVNISATVQVQCNGVDVAGLSQALGPQSVAANTSTTLLYSIPFTPSAGCAYTVVTTATSSAFSGRSSTVTTPFAADCVDQPCGGVGCTLTQGFWKNHPEDWPVTTLTLGTTTYTQAQLLSILNQPVKGNGLVSLAHQLIAAKLNIANGASGSAINSTIASADAIINGLVVPPVGSGSLSTSSVSSLVNLLDQFNSGLLSGGPGHCSE